MSEDDRPDFAERLAQKDGYIDFLHTKLIEYARRIEELIADIEGNAFGDHISKDTVLLELELLLKDL